MANRRPQNNGRRMDFGRNDRDKNFGRAGVSPWQGAGPGGGLPNLLPLAGGSTEATLALASNIINLLQPRQNPVPSLLDMPIRRDFGPNMGRYDRGFGHHRMGNQGNFRRTGNYNRAGERINTNRKQFRPNDGQRQQNKSSPKKEATSKAKPVKESDQDDKQENPETEQVESKEEDKKDSPKTRYDDVNSKLLKCHICNKSMWDGRSFENHLNGRAHAIMMQKTSESYALTADTMRQEFKIREMKRTRKIGQQPARDFYCAMCDMYAADGAAHRTTVGHRKLKKYLHPTCTSCRKEMPTRIELDEHRLTPEHLRNMQEKQEVISKPKPEVMVISTMDMEQLYLRDDRQRRHREPRGSAATHEEGEGEHHNEEGEEKQDEVEVKKEKDSEEEVKEDGAGEEKVEKEIDAENTVVDYKEGDDLTNVTKDMFPAYSTARGVGQSFLSEFRCVQCRLCRKLLDSEETAAVHLRTWRHHQLFLRLLADKTGISHDQEQKQTQENKRPSERSEDSGNWKRRKTTTDNDQEDNEHEDELNGHTEDVKLKEEETKDVDEQENNLLEGHTDTDMPAAEELEDWEQSVDEILEDEKNNRNEETDEQPKQVPEPEKTDEEKQVEVKLEKETAPPVSSLTPSTEYAKGSPRGGRGRGRGRGRRGRY